MVNHQRYRELRRRADVRVLRPGMVAHAVGEVIEVDYGAARARVVRSVSRPPTELETQAFREALSVPGSVIESFEFEYLESDQPTT